MGIIAERLCIKYGMFQNHDDGHIIIWPESASAINEALELAAREADKYSGNSIEVMDQYETADLIATKIRALKSKNGDSVEPPRE